MSDSNEKQAEREAYREWADAHSVYGRDSRMAWIGWEARAFLAQQTQAAPVAQGLTDEQIKHEAGVHGFYSGVYDEWQFPGDDGLLMFARALAKSSTCAEQVKGGDTTEPRDGSDRCAECGESGCGGRCYGDDMMGDS